MHRGIFKVGQPISIGSGETGAGAALSPSASVARWQLWTLPLARTIAVARARWNVFAGCFLLSLAAWKQGSGWAEFRGGFQSFRSRAFCGLMWRATDRRHVNEILTHGYRIVENMARGLLRHAKRSTSRIGFMGASKSGLQDHEFASLRPVSASN